MSLTSNGHDESFDEDMEAETNRNEQTAEIEEIVSSEEIDSNGAHQETEHLHFELNKKMAELESVKQLLEREEEFKEKINERLKRREDELLGCREEIKESKAKYSKLYKDNTNNLDKIASLEKIIESGRGRETTDRSIIEELRRNASQHEKDKDALNEKISDLEKTVENQLGNVGSINRRVAETNEDLAKLRRDYKTMEGEMRDLSSKNAELTRDNNHLMQRLDECERFRQLIPNVTKISDDTIIEGEFAFVFALDVLYLHFRFLSQYLQSGAKFAEVLDVHVSEKIRVLVEAMRLNESSFQKTVLTKYLDLDLKFVDATHEPDYVELLRKRPVIEMLEQLESRLTTFIKETLSLKGTKRKQTDFEMRDRRKRSEMPKEEVYMN